MSIKDEVDVVKAPWENSPYYEDAERWTHIFWSEDSLFQKFFSRLNLENVIELACGYGRHSEQVINKAARLTLIDVFENNLNKCRDRLLGRGNIRYILGNGFNFSPVEDNSITAIFCYDAMVHFSMDVMCSYLEDTSRVLKTGGMALYHHSNFQGPALAHYGQHPHARNVFNFKQFEEHARKCDLSIIDSVVMDWGGERGLDRLTLIGKQY